MKKDNILELLIRFIKDERFKKGDRLPSERQLGMILNASRATVRESIRQLEERELLTIKRGSGIYLNRGFENIGSEHFQVSPNKETLLKEQLEALFLITPVVVARAAYRAEEVEIQRLKDCIVRMSRAIVSKDVAELTEADMEFYQLLGHMSKNHKLSRLFEQLISGNEIIWSQLVETGAFENNSIFAGYVEIVNAIKLGNSAAAAEKAKKNLINVGKILSNIKNNRDLLQVFKNGNIEATSKE